MVRFLLLVVLLIGPPVCAQEGGQTPGFPVAKADPLYAHLAKWQAEMTPELRIGGGATFR